MQNSLISTLKKYKATLCIACKTQSPDRIMEVITSLQQENISLVVSENRIQEAESKYEFYKTLPFEKHFIGALQQNKVRKAIHIFDVIQSVSSLSLLSRIDRIAQEEGKMQRIFLSINISNDENKTGFSLSDFQQFKNEYQKNTFPNISIEGLFTILSEEDSTHPSNTFKKMKNLFDESSSLFGTSSPTLSMGMSNDYAQALENGSNMIRIGSALFGKRT